MSNDKRVVVTGGGKNLYKISESNGWYYVAKADAGFIGSNTSLGKTRSQKDALDLIKSHSGKDIQEIS